MAKAKRISGIDCDGAAAGGIKLVLVTRFDELEGLRAAALNWDDPEGVHSMRVASRRLRSALRDFTPYLRKASIASVQKRTRTLADALGQVRDQDVAIPALEKIVARAPAKFSPTLEKFVDSRKELRDQGRTALTAALQKRQLKQSKTDFTAAVNEATAARKGTARKSPPAEITLLAMSKAIILNRLGELEKLSKHVYQPFEIEALHEMRIATKRLRYAVELFQQCWGRSLATFAKRAARMQSSLGDIHDCDVWIESIGKQIGAARENRQHDEIEAFVWLLSHFVKARTKYARQVFERWSDWEAQEVSSKLRSALDSERRRKR